MLFIVSTFDECGVEEYKCLLRSIRQHSKGLKIRIAGLYGEISAKSQKELSTLIDDLHCFDSYESFKYYDSTYGKRLFHPLGKFAKLFFVREYLEAEAKPTDQVLFLDPDTVVQRPIKELLKYIVPGCVSFGHELQLNHHLQRDNQRLKVAEQFDDITGWKSTYVTEINTGVNLSIAEDFLRLMTDFEAFVRESDYLKNLDSFRDGVKWHDQDFFRYFYRKTMRLDIGCVDLGIIYTTTFGASKCIYYDTHAEIYKTNWDAVPIVVHFAGGTMGRVSHIEPLLRSQSDPVAMPDPSTEKPAVAPHIEPLATTPLTNVPVAESESDFTYPRHAVLASTGSKQLIERWLQQLPSGAQVLLVIPQNNRAEGQMLHQKYAANIRAVANVGIMDGSIHESLRDALSAFPRMESIMIPFLGEQVDLQFLPGNTMPDLVPYYKLMRGLWHQGLRNFAIASFSGVKHVKISMLLDHFVDRHKGKRCFIVGNGPSLNDLDMSLLKNEITFGANRCYLGYEKWGYDFTYWGIMDRLQIEEYGAEYLEHVPKHTPKFFPFEYATLMDMENTCPVPFDYDWRPPYKFSGSPDVLHLGFTVVHMMLQIAVTMGCGPIYLIGCDHRYNLDEKKKETLGTQGAQVWSAKDASNPTHFTDEYTSGSGEHKKFITPKPERMEEAFEVARKWCDEHGVQVFNATPDSGLEAFPMVDYSTLFAQPSTPTAPATEPKVPTKDYPAWARYERDTDSALAERIQCAETGKPLTSNDGAIAALKDIHQGKTVWLVGNGPSVRTEDLERLQGAVSFGCNRLYLAYGDMEFRPTYLCSTDEQMIWDFGQEMIDHHPGKTLFVHPDRPNLNGDFVHFRWGSSTPLEFSDNAYDFIMPGGGTLITAIQIGFHMGISKFYIYGMDHCFSYSVDEEADHYGQASGDGNHFIQGYRSGKPWAPPVLWQVEGALQSAQVFLQQHGGWIKNATRGGKLEVLERVDFDSVVKG